MTPVRRAVALSLLALSVTLGASCGGGQTHPNLFASDWEDDSGASIEAVRARLAGAQAPAGADVVVAVAGTLDKIIGLPLTGGMRWVFAHPIDWRPVVAGRVVVAAGGREVFALDVATGRKLWSRDTGGLALRGAGDDGSVTVMTFSKSTGHGAVLLAVARDGLSVRQIETDKELGAPAVIRGLAFVPWAGQYVSVIDLENGGETARVTMREATSRAWTSGGALYFGELGFFRFDANIGHASQGRATHIALPSREYAGTPVLMFPGVTPLRAFDSAHDKIRLFAAPDIAPSTALASGRVYASYFRYAMGFDAHTGALAWVRAGESDVVGGAAARGGLVTCDEAGGVSLLDAATGRKAGGFDLGEPVKSCTVSVDALQIRGTKGPPTESMVDQLEAAVRAAQPGMIAAQQLFLKEIGKVGDESATKALLEIASDPQTPAEALIAANIALAVRRNGEGYMIEALRHPYDYLRGVLAPPPVAPIAVALAGMKEPSAAALLAPYLLDPSSSAEDVKQVARALVVLATPEQVPVVKRFFGLYRTTTDSLEIADALVSAAKILMTRGRPDDRALVELAANDAMTAPAAKDALQTVVSAAAAARVGDAGTSEAGVEAGSPADARADGR